VALAELLAEIVLLPIALLLRVFGALPCDLMVKEVTPPAPDSGRFRKETESTLRIPDKAAADRFVSAVGEHVRWGGRLSNPVVAQWLRTESGTVMRGSDPWLWMRFGQAQL
ncbi:MAG: hypothetical protein ACRDTD_21650, partial [Pseudonocardiaceae bacterium]